MLVGVTIILFAIMRVAPGGPEAVLVGGEFSPETAARVRQRLGLDRPLVAQYAGWAGAALRGDLGRSFKTNDPVATLIVDRLGPTLQLTAGWPRFRFSRCPSLRAWVTVWGRGCSATNR